MNWIQSKLAKGIAYVLVALFMLQFTWAHCDTMEGPVIIAAKNALDSGNINYVLVWVKPSAEAELTTAFETALKSRSAESDMEFYETFVRLHREGEGAAYTGIKPGGTLDLITLAADRAIVTGNLEELIRLTPHNRHYGIMDRFKVIMQTKDYAVDDVEAGRRYVAAYVDYVHYAEGLSHEHSAGHTEGHEAHSATHLAGASHEETGADAHAVADEKHATENVHDEASSLRYVWIFAGIFVIALGAVVLVYIKK